MGLAAILELTVDSHSNAVCNQRAHLAEIQMDVSGTSVYLGSAQISDVKHGLKGKSLSSYYILLNQKLQGEGMHCWKPTSDPSRTCSSQGERSISCGYWRLP